MDALPIREPTKRVGIWIRVSTDEQASSDSPEIHRLRAEHYCKAKGWEVCEVYDLAGVSGKGVRDHPESKRMLADVKRKHITALVFSKLARLTRNARELMEFSDYFREHGADLVSLQENIDTSTPSGRLFYNMVAVMAHWEREEIGDRVKSSVAMRAKLGKPLGGRAPYGYKWQGDKIAVDPDEAPIRKLVYELFAEHKRKKTVARILNDRGYRTRNDARWSDTTIGWLITNPTAKGLHRTNYTHQSQDGGPVSIKPEHEHVYLPCEPIVSEELWNRCNDLLEARRVNHKQPAKRTVHTFSGYAVCACGGKMYVPSKRPKYVCAKCYNRIPCSDLEEIFIGEIGGYFLNREVIANYVGQADEVIGERERLLEKTEAEIRQLKSEGDKVVRLYKDDLVSAEQFRDLFQPSDLRRRELEAEVPRLQAEIDILKTTNLNEECLLGEAVDLQQRWPLMSPEEKRGTVELIVKSITIGKGDIHFEIVHLPSFRETANSQLTGCPYSSFWATPSYGSTCSGSLSVIRT